MQTEKMKDWEIQVVDRDGNILEAIRPFAVESCMNPGNFHIIPIERRKEGDRICFQCREQYLEVSETEIESGKVKLKKVPFVPEIKRQIHTCNPCTNCGRCSW